VHLQRPALARDLSRHGPEGVEMVMLGYTTPIDHTGHYDIDGLSQSTITCRCRRAPARILYTAFLRLSIEFVLSMFFYSLPATRTISLLLPSMFPEQIQRTKRLPDFSRGV
jgi:hypothetical protein